MRAALAAALAGLSLALAASASAAQISVGLAPGASPDEVASAVASATGGTVAADLGPLDALVLDVADAASAVAVAEGVPGVEYAEPVTASRRPAFEPNDPLARQQWYLGMTRAFTHWAEMPVHPPVRVAVVDSGIDAGHPEFAGRIIAARSFVGSSASVDATGHGTIVAGEIAAIANNEAGIAGVGLPVELLVAKVVDDRGRISILAEARAIRWAVDRGAQVINLSLGGPRDPTNPARDTYSHLEHAAVDYATRRGVVVVAAAGNCSRAACPEPFAAYPAALPHVLGVGALARNATVPAFSNRDRIHVDVAAPGVDIVSTHPRALSAATCAPRGFTVCARDAADRSPRGTSFAAPLATGAAALLLGERGLLGGSRLHSSQVTTILQRSAVDVGPPGRDPRSGFGRIDVPNALAALSRPLPSRDRFEPNDDVGARAHTLGGRKATIEATLDRFDDVRDVYRIRLVKGQRLVVRLNGPARANSNLFLWRPGARSLVAGPRRADRLRASTRPGAKEAFSFRATRAGWYFVEVRMAGGPRGLYRLSYEKRR